MDPALRQVDILSGQPVPRAVKKRKSYVQEDKLKPARNMTMPLYMLRMRNAWSHTRVNYTRVQALLVIRRSSLISAYSLPVEI